MPDVARRRARRTTKSVEAGEERSFFRGESGRYCVRRGLQLRRELRRRRRRRRRFFYGAAAVAAAAARRCKRARGARVVNGGPLFLRGFRAMEMHTHCASIRERQHFLFFSFLFTRIGHYLAERNHRHHPRCWLVYTCRDTDRSQQNPAVASASSS